MNLYIFASEQKLFGDLELTNRLAKGNTDC